MKIANLENMVRGWLVGNFEPSLYKTTSVEVAVKHYCAGEEEIWHFHKIATEITVIVAGRVKMNGKELVAGDIVVVEPGEGTDFQVLENSITTVIKLPGANNDKYIKAE